MEKPIAKKETSAAAQDASAVTDTINFTIFKTPYRFSLAAGAGVLLGQAEEIVYKYAGRDDYLSQLLWDLKPLVYLGTALAFSRGDPLAGMGAVADLSVKFGLPILSGAMEDRDWYDSGVSGNSYDDTYLTNFSSSDAYIQGAMLLDFSGGVSIPIASTVAIKALASFSYMRFSWIAQNGYLQYMRDNWEKKYKQGTLISYDQNWLILSPGIGLSWPFHRVFDLDFRFFISPLIWSWDMDTHLVPSNLYYDTMKGGLYLEPALDFSFAPNRYLSLILHGSWRYITGARGDTSAISVGAAGSAVPTLYENVAGAGYSAFDLGLSLKLALPLGSKKN